MGDDDPARLLYKEFLTREEAGEWVGLTTPGSVGRALSRLGLRARRMYSREELQEAYGLPRKLRK